MTLETGDKAIRPRAKSVDNYKAETPRLKITQCRSLISIRHFHNQH